MLIEASLCSAIGIREYSARSRLLITTSIVWIMISNMHIIVLSSRKFPILCLL